MYQKLVISPLTFPYLDNLNSEQRDEFYNMLKTETILCDRENNLLIEYESEGIKSRLGKENLIYLSSFINLITINGKLKSVENIDSPVRKFREFHHLENEKKLANNDSVWKIILRDIVSGNFTFADKIEISGVNNYLNPAASSRIRTIETIERNKNEEFPFRKWILKYLKDAKEIIIKEGFLATNKILQNNLSYILSKINKDTPIKIYTLSEKAIISIDPLEANVNEMLNEFASKYRLTNLKKYIVDEGKQLKDRYIKTDKFIINSGHLLEAITPLDKVVKHFTATVSRYKQ